MFSRIRLKPHVPLCGLSYLRVIELTLFALMFLLAQHKIAYSENIYIYDFMFQKVKKSPTIFQKFQKHSEKET